MGVPSTEAFVDGQVEAPFPVGRRRDFNQLYGMRRASSWGIHHQGAHHSLVTCAAESKIFNYGMGKKNCTEKVEYRIVLFRF